MVIIRYKVEYSFWEEDTKSVFKEIVSLFRLLYRFNYGVEYEMSELEFF